MSDADSGANSEAQKTLKYDIWQDLRSYYAKFAILLQPLYECVFCIKARGPVMDASFDFCLDSNKDEHNLTNGTFISLTLFLRLVGWSDNTPLPPPLSLYLPLSLSLIFSSPPFSLTV